MANTEPDLEIFHEWWPKLPNELQSLIVKRAVLDIPRYVNNGSKSNWADYAACGAVWQGAVESQTFRELEFGVSGLAEFEEYCVGSRCGFLKSVNFVVDMTACVAGESEQGLEAAPTTASDNMQTSSTISDEGAVARERMMIEDAFSELFNSLHKFELSCDASNITGKLSLTYYFNPCPEMATSGPLAHRPREISLYLEAIGLPVLASTVFSTFRQSTKSCSAWYLSPPSFAFLGRHLRNLADCDMKLGPDNFSTDGVLKLAFTSSPFNLKAIRCTRGLILPLVFIRWLEDRRATATGLSNLTSFGLRPLLFDAPAEDPIIANRRRSTAFAFTTLTNSIFSFTRHLTHLHLDYTIDLNKFFTACKKFDQATADNPYLTQKAWPALHTLFVRGYFYPPGTIESQPDHPIELFINIFEFLSHMPKLERLNAVACHQSFRLSRGATLFYLDFRLNAADHPARLRVVHFLLTQRLASPWNDHVRSLRGPLARLDIFRFRNEGEGPGKQTSAKLWNGESIKSQERWDAIEDPESDDANSDNEQEDDENVNDPDHHSADNDSNHDSDHDSNHVSNHDSDHDST